MTVRSNFDKALMEIQQDILRVASLVEESIYNSMEALNSQDVVLAAKVIEGDDVIDDLKEKIENKCITLIATQQPIAKDLRVVITGIKILVSLERIGDHSVDIARTTMCLAEQKLIKPLVDLTHMAKLVQDMVRDGLDAYVHGDVEKAREMCDNDDEVDDLYHKIFRELTVYMKKDPETIDQAVYLMFISRFLERIGDHATNIGENVIYLVTGEKEELN
ncbi:phosphate transport system protein [Desulfohalotomaculum tongense]|uniref:phosphate signaling complex protein PhoU n=1 Tax=Desulforadius tongensis TaxID=1216062 RepID=UPI001959913F|nr:phosphate signaling complex protein PhoU [Desulforadius tongensis]MBM7855238.1 phosphate transport system protein [Desulforadius tongensis]